LQEPEKIDIAAILPPSHKPLDFIEEIKQSEEKPAAILDILNAKSGNEPKSHGWGEDDELDIDIPLEDSERGEERDL